MRNNNDNKVIINLIGKFFEGETSVDEEKALYVYFRSGRVAPEMEKYRSLFCGFSSIDTSGVCVSDKRKTRSRAFGYRKAIAGLAAAVAVVFGGPALYYRYYDKHLSALYGGSYIVVNGERVDNLRSIRKEIKETLCAASLIEDKAYANNTIAEVEQNVLNSISSEKEREMVYRLLND